MQRALVDTNVLFSAVYKRDEHHSRGAEILRGLDSGSLPEAVVLDYVLAETTSGITRRAGNDAALDFLDRVESNDRFHVVRPTNPAFAGAKRLFRQYEPLSLVDAAIVSHARHNNLGYVYSFDDDFDAYDDLDRLDAAVDPYAT